jgi:lysophospholipase L1-like esterase
MDGAVVAEEPEPATPIVSVEPKAQSTSAPALETAAAPPVADAPAPEVRATGPVVPVLDPELHRVRRLAQERVLGFESPPGPYAFGYAGDAAAPTAPSPDSGLGRFVAIENEAALGHFHDALARLAQNPGEQRRVRILAYGASHTQADLYTGYLRAYLQRRFGDGGQGFVLLGRVNRWYRTLDSSANHHGLQVVYARPGNGPGDEPLGLFGAALLGKYTDGVGEVFTSKDSASTQFEVHYLIQPNGGDFVLKLDGNQLARIATRGERVAPGYYTFQTTPGAHRIHARVAGNGPVRLFGVVAESDTPGVVVDTLGISGTRMADQLRWREDVWAETVRRRAPSLVTFAYGTNEVNDTKLTLAAYESGVTRVIERLRRAVPNASCLLITPFDLSAAMRPRLLRILDAQRRLSRELGCAFWDGYSFMGGEGSMTRWIKAKPPFASPDHIHLTRRGYVCAGIAIGDALMRAYDLAAAQPAEAPRASIAGY